MVQGNLLVLCKDVPGTDRNLVHLVEKQLQIMMRGLIPVLQPLFGFSLMKMSKASSDFSFESNTSSALSPTSRLPATLPAHGGPPPCSRYCSLKQMNSCSLHPHCLLFLPVELASFSAVHFILLTFLGHLFSSGAHQRPPPPPVLPCFSSITLWHWLHSSF